MEVYMYYKMPGMSKGKTTGPFDSFSDIVDFVELAPDEMPDNTLMYYRKGMGGRVWLLRGGKVFSIWHAQGPKRKGISMAEAMKAAPNVPDSELAEMKDKLG